MSRAAVTVESKETFLHRGVRRVPSALLLALASLAVASSSQAASPDGAVQAAPASFYSDQPQEPGVALVTGSTSGLGREVALRLGSEGFHVIVHGRNLERGMEVVEAIRGSGGSASFYPADLASLNQVRELVNTVVENYSRLDLLVNNAGVWLEAEDGRVLSEDGYELHFQVNYLSHYLLTDLLLPRLLESAPARVVNVASAAQRPIDFDDVMLEEGYTDGGGYAQSKLAQIMHAFDLAEELDGTGVVVNALHPATFMDTEMVLSRGAEPRSSVEEGAEAVMQLLLDEEVGSGGYYNGVDPAEAHEQANDPEARTRLREISDALVATGA